MEPPNLEPKLLLWLEKNKLEQLVPLFRDVCINIFSNNFVKIFS